MLDGTGLATTEDGLEYEGTFKDGEPQGPVTLFFPDGTALIGRLSADGIEDCVKWDAGRAQATKMAADGETEERQLSHTEASVIAERLGLKVPPDAATRIRGPKLQVSGAEVLAEAFTSMPNLRIVK